MNYVEAPDEIEKQWLERIFGKEEAGRIMPSTSTFKTRNNLSFTFGSAPLKRHLSKNTNKNVSILMLNGIAYPNLRT